MTESERAIPEGFEPHFRKSSLTDPWEPLFSKRTPNGVHIGLCASAAHTNSRGFVHGGLIATLADNAMGLSCAQQLDGRAKGGLVTVSLSVDYLASVSLGQWLEICPEVIKIGKSLTFVNALVKADDRICARANATFQIVGG